MQIASGSVLKSELPLWGWYFTAQQHRPVPRKLTGILFFPFVAVVFVACCWWEMTFVTALLLSMPLGFTVIPFEISGEALTGFSGTCTEWLVTVDQYNFY